MRPSDSRPHAAPRDPVAEDSALAALVERHRSGDPSALNALMVEIYPSIHRIVFRLAGVRGRDAHEDLVQSALEQVCRSIDAFEGRSRLSTFVFGICHRVVARSRRYERVRSWFKRDAEEACLPQGSASPDELLDRARGVAGARAALDELGAEERAAFVLHEVEDLPLEEVATALRCSTRTVKRRLRAAREKLIARRPEAQS
ncbi:MAG TPA: RNA polymerase sigma factor [Polyangia bacterium]|nr:RNA polymerase sigma factor [Polyangia bacterium]